MESDEEREESAARGPEVRRRDAPLESDDDVGVVDVVVDRGKREKGKCPDNLEVMSNTAAGIVDNGRSCG